MISIVGVIIAEIFFNTLKGSNKSSLITKIKQNGQTSLEVMDKAIRNADNVVCISFNGDVLTIELGGIYTRYSIQRPPASNSFLAQDHPISFDSTTCDPSTVSLSKPINITDTTQIKVDIPNYDRLFSRNKSPGFKDVVSISFQIAPGVEVSNSISSQIDPIPFATSIGLR